VISRSACWRAAARSARACCASVTAVSRSRTAVSRAALACATSRSAVSARASAAERPAEASASWRSRCRCVLLRCGRVLGPGRGRRRPRRRLPRPSRRTPPIRRPVHLLRGPPRPRWRRGPRRCGGRPRPRPGPLLSVPGLTRRAARMPSPPAGRRRRAVALASRVRHRAVFRGRGCGGGSAAHRVVVSSAALVAAEPAGPAPFTGRVRSAAPGPSAEAVTGGHASILGHDGRCGGHGMTSKSFASFRFVSRLEAGCAGRRHGEEGRTPVPRRPGPAGHS
jgi:hypothetical protein